MRASDSRRSGRPLDAGGDGPADRPDPGAVSRCDQVRRNVSRHPASRSRPGLRWPSTALRPPPLGFQRFSISAFQRLFLEVSAFCFPNFCFFRALALPWVTIAKAPRPQRSCAHSADALFPGRSPIGAKPQTPDIWVLCPIRQKIQARTPCFANASRSAAALRRFPPANIQMAVPLIKQLR